MSGGYFDYDQYRIGGIADSIEYLIEINNGNEVNERGDPVGYRFAEETIEDFKTAVHILRLAEVYANRIDWLISGDDGEDSFNTRLNEEMKIVNQKMAKMYNEKNNEDI